MHLFKSILQSKMYMPNWRHWLPWFYVLHILIYTLSFAFWYGMNRFVRKSLFKYNEGSNPNYLVFFISNLFPHSSPLLCHSWSLQPLQLSIYCRQAIIFFYPFSLILIHEFLNFVHFPRIIIVFNFGYATDPTFFVL